MEFGKGVGDFKKGPKVKKEQEIQGVSGVGRLSWVSGVSKRLVRPKAMHACMRMQPLLRQGLIA